MKQLNAHRYKKNIQIFKLLCVFACIVSCKKKGTNNPEPVVIDYPKAYVVNGGSNTISILNLQDLTEKQIIQLTDVGRFPHHLNLSPNGKKIAVAIPEFDFTLGHALLHNATDKKGGVAVIDAQTGTTLLKIALPNANFNAAFSPDGSEIWTATATHTGEMYVFDANTGIQKTKIALGADPSEVTFSKDGQYAFVALGESSFVYVLKVSTKEIIKTIKVDPYPTNVWAGNDGKIYVENKVALSINIIDTQTLTAIEYIDINFKPGQVAYNQSLNELWICQAGENKVAYFERKNNVWNLKGNIQTGDDAHAVTFSKDEKTAFVVNQVGNTVSVIEAAKHSKTKDINVGKQPNGIVLKENID
ncbi:beta-propeller fold lactonase family protein [Emticicia sp. SJ17W-69]|uniref:beta-propeller fold lactonase family protein n=1 Tax=Emticicia sp. SJ17W-69 TaxID=3421657 RepID=UPI003EBDC7EC